MRAFTYYNLKKILYNIGYIVAKILIQMFLSYTNDEYKHTSLEV